MFQFPGFAPNTYAFSVEYPEGWVAPFRNPKITVRLPTPLGLSQVPTSFIASRHQDIRRVPLYLVTNLMPQLAFARHVLKLFTPAWFSRSHADLTSPSVLRPPAPSDSDSFFFAYALHFNHNRYIAATSSFTCRGDPSETQAEAPFAGNPAG